MKKVKKMKNNKLYRDYLLDDIKRLIDSNGYTMNIDQLLKVRKKLDVDGNTLNDWSRDEVFNLIEYLGENATPKYHYDVASDAVISIQYEHNNRSYKLNLYGTSHPHFCLNIGRRAVFSKCLKSDKTLYDRIKHYHPDANFSYLESKFINSK